MNCGIKEGENQNNNLPNKRIYGILNHSVESYPMFNNNILVNLNLKLFLI